MDLSLYLIDLLAQHGEVTVPGLGRFSNTRASAYYDDAEGKFYPPHNTISYDQQYDHDIRFAQHIAAKKGISVASAGFFIDKYVDGLLQEVAVNDAHITDLGWLRYDGIKITFKPDVVSGNNPAFFGLPVIESGKIGQPFVPKQNVPDLSFSFSPETKPAPAAQAPEPVFESVDLTKSSPEQQYFQEDEYVYEEKRHFNIWIIVAIALIVLGAAAIGIYFYKPSLLGIAEKSKPLVNAPVDSALRDDSTVRSAPTPVNDVVVSSDNSTTVIQGETGVINTDTTVIPETKTQIIDEAPAAKPEEVVDTRTRQEVQAGAYNTEKRATQSLSIFTARGLDAKVVKGNKRYIITLGTFYTYDEARAFQKELIATKKVKTNETIIKDYPPNKK